MRLRNMPIALSVAIFLFAGTVATAHPRTMMGTDGHMLGCPFMGVPALCAMDQLEHAFTLQAMLTAIPLSDFFAFLVSILVALSLAFLASSLWNRTLALFEPLLRPPSRTRRALPRHALQGAFANGILHSKAF